MSNEINENLLKNSTESAIAAFCPFGYLDIQRAVQVALEVGEDYNWAVEQIEQFRDECCEGKLEGIDPVYIVYDSILQHARNEISDLTDYDFLNDFNIIGEIYVAANFYCTSFDYSEEAKEELTKILKKKKVKPEDLDEKTTWFLEQLEIDLKPKKSTKGA